MIQRKQTLFLLIALICLLVCLCIPIAHSNEATLGLQPNIIYNYGILSGKEGFSFTIFPLAVIVAFNAVLTLWAIFDYKKRKRQAKTCIYCMLLSVAYYIVYGIYYLYAGLSDMNLTLAYGICLPLIAFILTWMARRGILADEALVRAADRIR